MQSEILMIVRYIIKKYISDCVKQSEILMMARNINGCKKY